MVRQQRVFTGRVEQAVVDRAAFDAKAQRQCDRFQDGGFAAAIFANEERHVGMELDRLQFAHCGNIEGEVVESDLVAEVGPHPLQIGLGAEAIHGE